MGRCLFVTGPTCQPHTSGLLLPLNVSTKVGLAQTAPLLFSQELKRQYRCRFERSAIYGASASIACGRL